MTSDIAYHICDISSNDTNFTHWALDIKEDITEYYPDGKILGNICCNEKGKFVRHFYHSGKLMSAYYVSPDKTQLRVYINGNNITYYLNYRLSIHQRGKYFLHGWQQMCSKGENYLFHMPAKLSQSKNFIKVGLGGLYKHKDLSGFHSITTSDAMDIDSFAVSFADHIFKLKEPKNIHICI